MVEKLRSFKLWFLQLVIALELLGKREQGRRIVEGEEVDQGYSLVFWSGYNFSTKLLAEGFHFYPMYTNRGLSHKLYGIVLFFLLLF